MTDAPPTPAADEPTEFVLTELYNEDGVRIEYDPDDEVPDPATIQRDMIEGAIAKATDRAT